jgi:hypothetical protein
LSGVIAFDGYICYSIFGVGGSGNVPLGTNLDLGTPVTFCSDVLCTPPPTDPPTTAPTAPTFYICPSDPTCTQYNSLAECEASGCVTCAEGLCP